MHAHLHGPHMGSCRKPTRTLAHARLVPEGKQRSDAQAPFHTLAMMNASDKANMRQAKTRTERDEFVRESRAVHAQACAPSPMLFITA
jgi:hypothetical protein